LIDLIVTFDLSQSTAAPSGAPFGLLKSFEPIKTSVTQLPSIDSGASPSMVAFESRTVMAEFLT
jgi:hypothetical protein